MQRKENWDLQLHNYIEAAITTPFAWGTHDCCTHVADAVLAMTDIDLAAEFRGTYESQLSAFKRIKGVTGGSNVEDVCEYVMKKHEIEELPSVHFAQRGDVVVFDGDDGVALGIVHLNGIDALFVSETGLHKIPVLNCRRAWGIR